MGVNEVETWVSIPLTCFITLVALLCLINGLDGLIDELAIVL
jgi:hypothetical protein